MAQQQMSSSQKALMLELKSLQEEPVEGFRITLVDESDLYNWEVAIFGPPNTLYEGGYFKVRAFPPRRGPRCGAGPGPGLREGARARPGQRGSRATAAAALLKCSFSPKKRPAGTWALGEGSARPPQAAPCAVLCVCFTGLSRLEGTPGDRLVPCFHILSVPEGNTEERWGEIVYKSF